MCAECSCNPRWTRRTRDLFLPRSSWHVICGWWIFKLCQHYNQLLNRHVWQQVPSTSRTCEGQLWGPVAACGGELRTCKGLHKSRMIYYPLSLPHCATEDCVMYCILFWLRIPLSSNADDSARVVRDGSSAVKLSFISHVSSLVAFSIKGMMWVFWMADVL